VERSVTKTRNIILLTKNPFSLFVFPQLPAQRQGESLLAVRCKVRYEFDLASVNKEIMTRGALVIHDHDVGVCVSDRGHKFIWWFKDQITQVEEDFAPVVFYSWSLILEHEGNEQTFNVSAIMDAAPQIEKSGESVRIK